MPNPIRLRAVEGLKQGHSFTYSRRFNQQETELFGDMTRDYNPVHYDLRWAEAKGFSGLICHGLLVGGMLCELGGQLAWLASSMSFRFLKPVYFGDTVTCTIRITEVTKQCRAKATARLVNQRGADEKLLPHPVGVALNQFILPLRQVEELHETPGPAIGLITLPTPESGDKTEELGPRKLLVEVGPIGDVPYAGFCCFRGFGQIFSTHQNLTGGG